MDREFLNLVRLEPRLGLLWLEAATYRDGDPDYCCMTAWYEPVVFKARLVRLVGATRRGESIRELETSAAYDTAYAAILDALPSCRGDCGCGESRAAS